MKDRRQSSILVASLILFLHCTTSALPEYCLDDRLCRVRAYPPNGFRIEELSRKAESRYCALAHGSIASSPDTVVMRNPTFYLDPSVNQEIHFSVADRAYLLRRQLFMCRGTAAINPATEAPGVKPCHRVHVDLVMIRYGVVTVVASLSRR